MNPTMKQYAFWVTEEDYGYWMLYDSLEDAVREAKGEDIFEFNAKRLGKYKTKVVIIKDKSTKKKSTEVKQ